MEGRSVHRVVLDRRHQALNRPDILSILAGIAARFRRHRGQQRAVDRARRLLHSLAGLFLAVDQGASLRRHTALLRAHPVEYRLIESDLRLGTFLTQRLLFPHQREIVALGFDELKLHLGAGCGIIRAFDRVFQIAEGHLLERHLLVDRGKVFRQGRAGKVAFHRFPQTLAGQAHKPFARHRRPVTGQRGGRTDQAQHRRQGDGPSSYCRYPHHRLLFVLPVVHAPDFALDRRIHVHRCELAKAELRRAARSTSVV